MNDDAATIRLTRYVKQQRTLLAVNSNSKGLNYTTNAQGKKRILVLYVKNESSAHSRRACLQDTEHMNFNVITKTRLFKYTENFTTKKWKFSDKIFDIFQISAQNIDCVYSLEPPRRGGSNEYPQSTVLPSIHNLCFEQK